jgi:hypothetical protein
MTARPLDPDPLRGYLCLPRPLGPAQARVRCPAGRSSRGCPPRFRAWLFHGMRPGRVPLLGRGSAAWNRTLAPADGHSARSAVSVQVNLTWLHTCGLRHDLVIDGDRVGLRLGSSIRHHRTDLYDLDVMLTYSASPHPSPSKFEHSRELKWALKDDDVVPRVRFGPARVRVPSESCGNPADIKGDLHGCYPFVASFRGVGLH